MARSTTVPAAGNIARKSFAGEEKAKEEYYAEQLKKYGRLMVYSNKKKNGFYLIEPAEGGETVASRYTADGGKIRQETFDPKALPASSDEATWRSRGLSLEECEQIKEKRSLSNRRKQWLDSVIEQAYQGKDPAEIANGVSDNMQYTDDLTNPVIYQDYRGTTLYMDFTGKALENGEEKRLNQEEGSYLSQGLKNRWISFEGGLSSADWQAVYDGVEEKYDNIPGFKPVNSVQKAAVLSYGKELSQGDLDKLGDLADLIKDDYDPDPNRFYKTDLSAKSIKGAFTYTELTVAGEVAAVPFKHKELERIAKRLENGEKEKARALMLEKFQEATLAKAKSLIEEKAGQSPLDEMKSFQKLSAAKEFKEMAKKMGNQTERELDLENLKQLQEQGKIENGEDLEKIADQLPAWRESDYWEDKIELAYYGRDKDLDKLVNYPEDDVREEVAKRGRDKDLDKLVSDDGQWVRETVAEVGRRDKDLDKLLKDEEEEVRIVAGWVVRDKDLENLKQLQEDGKIEQGINIEHVADQLPAWRESEETQDKVQLAKYGRDSDLDKLEKDPEFWGQYYQQNEYGANKEGWKIRVAVANRGRDKDLDGLAFDDDPDVRAAVARQGRDKDLDLLLSDENPVVLRGVVDAGRDQDLEYLSYMRAKDDSEWEVREFAKEKMREKDLANLQEMQEDGKIEQGVDLEAVADKMPQWRISNSWFDRQQLASVGRDYDLDKLVKDPDWRVRHMVALRGRDKDLDKLIDDHELGVRAGVAKAGRDKDLDRLVSDESKGVRAEVAKRGRDKDLDKLVNDPDEYVRSTANRERDLENLKNLQAQGKLEKGADLENIADQLPGWRESEEASDKINLAKCGRDSDLDQLVSDEDWSVRVAVARRGRDQDLDQLIDDKHEYVRAVIAEAGRDKDLDKLRIDDSERVRAGVAAAGRNEDLDILVHDMSEYVRATVAYQGRDKDLDRLAHDSDFTVRETVADVGRDKDLDKLVSDPNPEVREHVADQGRDKDLDILVSDKDATVRMIVAYQGRDKDLDRLVSDSNWQVRQSVAEAGRDKDLLKLMKDRNSEVRHDAEYIYKYGTERSDKEEENTPELLEKRRTTQRQGLER